MRPSGCPQTQCGFGINNAGLPLCELTSTTSDNNAEYALAQTVPGVLAYNYGRLSGWRRALADPLHRRLGMCSADVMGGRFESGADVTAALFDATFMPLNATGSGIPETRVAMLALHDGGTAPAPLQLVFCGAPIAKPGLVWTSFALVQPNRLPA